MEVGSSGEASKSTYSYNINSKEVGKNYHSNYTLKNIQGPIFLRDFVSRPEAVFYNFTLLASIMQVSNEFY